MKTITALLLLLTFCSSPTDNISIPGSLSVEGMAQYQVTGFDTVSIYSSSNNLLNENISVV